MGLSTKHKLNKIENDHLELPENKSLLIRDLPINNKIQSETLLSFNLLKAE